MRQAAVYIKELRRNGAMVTSNRNVCLNSHETAAQTLAAHGVVAEPGDTVWLFSNHHPTPWEAVVRPDGTLRNP